MANSKIDYWASQRRKYLEAEYPKQAASMEKAGTLEPHCQEVAQDALEMLETVTTDLENRPEVQAMEYAPKVQALEAIPLQAREMVQHDVIQAPL